jgi:hypothetical protein
MRRSASRSPRSHHAGGRGAARVNSRRHAAVTPSIAPLFPPRDPPSGPLLRGIEASHRPRFVRPLNFDLVETDDRLLYLVVPDLDALVAIRRISRGGDRVTRMSPTRSTVSTSRPVGSSAHRKRTIPGRPICRR